MSPSRNTVCILGKYCYLQEIRSPCYLIAASFLSELCCLNSFPLNISTLRIIYEIFLDSCCMVYYFLYIFALNKYKEQ